MRPTPILHARTGWRDGKMDGRSGSRPPLNARPERVVHRPTGRTFFRDDEETARRAGLVITVFTVGLAALALGLLIATLVLGDPHAQVIR